MELPDPVRQRLGNFSRTVFSDSSRTGPEHNEGPDNEMASSLPLQMSLYFNTYFFPLWWVSCIMMLQMKYSVLPDYYKFIVITVIILITLIEAIRLYLGYMGNLQEKFPAYGLGKQQRMAQVLGTLHLCGRPRRSSWLLASHWFSSNHCSHLHVYKRTLEVPRCRRNILSPC
ncbi:transmembrane protein 17 isoform X2 [Ochotona princeps]|uniref:transmembrane protein 17 isoform X2 n=1 Tax=Ochotona princeps TaxID=9978 RepID=UPI0027151F64|nr:transmembrane protein 17 isoform X2 [Ochotona princeps]